MTRLQIIASWGIWWETITVSEIATTSSYIAYSDHARRARRSICWTRAGSIHAHSFSSGRVGYRAHTSSRRGCCYTAWPRWSFRWRRLHFGGWLLHDFDSCRPEKHSPSHLAVEVPLSFNTSIVFAGVILEFHSNPVASCKVWLPYVTNYRVSTIGELHRLANIEGCHFEEIIEVRGSWGISSLGCTLSSWVVRLFVVFKVVLYILFGQEERRRAGCMPRR